MNLKVGWLGALGDLGTPGGRDHDPPVLSSFSCLYWQKVNAR
jgi:hypothetical protein